MLTPFLWRQVRSNFNKPRDTTLYKYPEKKAAVIGYNSDFVSDHSQEARKYYERSGANFNPSKKKKTDWGTDGGGGFFGTSINGSITGKGFQLAIVDDPIKGIDDAFSQTKRDYLKDWWGGDFYTRLEPNAAMIVIHTRWHRDDLAGWLLHREREFEEEGLKEDWEIVSQPAIRTENRIDYPDNCNVFPDNREVGEPLCPQRYDKNELRKIREQVGSYKWNALYQQRPTTEEGNIWKADWFNIYDELPEDVYDVGYDYDLAYTKKETNSASAYVKAGKDKDGNIYIIDLDYDWLEFPDLMRWMVSNGGPHYIEDKASGKSAKQSLQDNGIYAQLVSVEGDKVARSKLASPLVERGDVYVNKRIIDTLLSDPNQGILDFPNGRGDDVNDAFVQALNRLGDLGEKEKKQTIGGFNIGGMF